MNFSVSDLKSVVDAAATASLDDVGVTIGVKLRGIRAQRGLTIEQLAQMSELSVGLLSQIERGKSNPSMRTIQRLKRALGVNLWELLQDVPAVNPDTQPGLAVEVNYVRRKENRLRLVVGESRMVKDLLSPRNDSSLLFMIITLPPRGQSEDAVIGKGEKAGMVIEGKLRLTVGESSFELKAGDSFQFPSTQMHSLSNPSDEPTKLLWIMCVVESRI